jgi:hypothetical protein
MNNPGMTEQQALDGGPQIQAGHRAHQISHREDLFRDFLVAASKTYGQTMMSNQPDLQDLVGLYGMINRMQVVCLPRTIACAQRVARDARNLFPAEQDVPGYTHHDERRYRDRSVERIR